MALTQVTSIGLKDGEIVNADLHSAASVALSKLASTGALGSAITATTQSASDDSTKLATTAFVQAAVTSLIDGAPGSLNTLNELAAAINDDSSYATTLTTALATKLPLAGGTLTGTLNVDSGSNGMIDFGDTGSAFGRLYADSTGTFIGSKTQHVLWLRTNNIQRIKVSDTSAATSIGGAFTFNAMLTTQGDISGGLLMLKASENTNRFFISGNDTSGCEVNLYDDAGSQKGIVGVSSSEFFLKAPNNSAPLTFYTHNGSSIGERLRITSAGLLLLGTTDSGFSSGYTTMTIGNTSTSNTGLTIVSSAANGYSRLHFADGNSGAARYAGFIAYNHGSDELLFGTGNSGSSQVLMNSDGSFQIGQNNNDVAKLEIRYSTVPAYITNSYDGTSGESTFSNNIARTSDGSGSWGSFNNASYGAGAIQLLSTTSGSSINFQTASATNTNPTEHVRIDEEGHIRILNESNSGRELRWYNQVGGSAIAATIGWGNGNANWEFRHFRNDNQANNPYANIDFFTGAWSTGTPTRALRITNDGNHIREKHSRFATRIDYDGGNEAVNSKIPFKTPHVNVGSDFDSSNERYVAPVDGDYAFWFFTNVARSGAGSYYATWRKNGSEVNSIAGGRMYDQHTGSGWNNLSGCLMINLDEGDYIEIFNGTVAVNYDGTNYGQWMGWLVG